MRIRSKEWASGAVEARCLSPALILHAQLPSGFTAMLVSTGPSPGGVAVMTIELSPLTRTPVRPSPKSEQKNRTIGSACHAAAAASFRHAASDLATASRSASSAALGRGPLAQFTRQPLVAPQRDGRVAGSGEGGQRDGALARP